MKYIISFDIRNVAGSIDLNYWEALSKMKLTRYSLKQVRSALEDISAIEEKVKYYAAHKIALVRINFHSPLLFFCTINAYTVFIAENFAKIKFVTEKIKMKRTVNMHNNIFFNAKIL